jgi:hypothetical protein
MDANPVVIWRHSDYAPCKATFELFHDAQVVEAGSFDDAREMSMSMMEMEHGATMFWFIDGRYDVDSRLEWMVTEEKRLLRFMTMCNYGERFTYIDEPAKAHGCAYYLPTHSMAQLPFLTFNGHVDEMRQLPADFKDWQFKDVPHFAGTKLFPFSAVIIQHDEPDDLVVQLSRQAKVYLHVDGVHVLHSGGGTIKESHRKAAELSESQMMLVLDADLRLDPYPECFYDLYLDEWEYVHLWKVRNPINGLVYGHGGLKMFNREHLLREAVRAGTDMTTTIGRGLTVHDVCVGTHAFNWSPFSTWRTAVREAAKLSRQEDPESKARLDVWLNEADSSVPHASFCVEGSRKGVEIAAQSVNMEWVNDYPYLLRLFTEHYGG